MSIKKWPKEDRPREKLLANGAASLSDSELLAIFIRCGTKGRSALDIAKALITQSGSLNQLLTSPPHQCMQLPGIGPTRYSLLQAALELGKRVQNQPQINKLSLTKVEHVKCYIARQLSNQSREVFACLFLDKHIRLIKFEILFQGTIDQTPVYPREIMRRAMHHNASRIILAHNHPSGQVQPSQADLDITRIIQEAATYFNLEIVDHIIVGSQQQFSFAENGLI